MSSYSVEAATTLCTRLQYYHGTATTRVLLDNALSLFLLCLLYRNT